MQVDQYTGKVEGVQGTRFRHVLRDVKVQHYKLIVEFVRGRATRKTNLGIMLPECAAGAEAEIGGVILIGAAYAAHPLIPGLDSASPCSTEAYVQRHIAFAYQRLISKRVCGNDVSTLLGPFRELYQRLVTYYTLTLSRLAARNPETQQYRER